MIYYTSWLNNDAQTKARQRQQNETIVGRYYENFRLIRSAISQLAEAPRRAWQRWRVDIRIRASIAELSRLDDRLLRDIGVARHQIPYLATQAVNAEYASIVETPSARPPEPDALISPAAPTECQIIPLPLVDRKHAIQRNDHDREAHPALPMSAA